jgi:hypothetical protein
MFLNHVRGFLIFAGDNVVVESSPYEEVIFEYFFQSRLILFIGIIACAYQNYRKAY